MPLYDEVAAIHSHHPAGKGAKGQGLLKTQHQAHQDDESANRYSFSHAHTPFPMVFVRGLFIHRDTVHRNYFRFTGSLCDGIRR
jgi:hypothetical protein